MKTLYHKFLLKHRVYCELCSAPMPATQVIRSQGWRKEICVCDAHYRANTPIETGLKTRGALEGTR